MLERVWKKGNPLCIAGGSVNWYSHYGRQYGDSLKTRNKTTIWPSNPTTGHILRENHNSKRHMYPNAIETLFTIASTWKQPRCPSTGERIKKMWYVDIMEYYSTLKKERNWVICSDVDEPRVCRTEWSKSENGKIILYINTYIWNLEKWYWWTYL